MLFVYLRLKQVKNFTVPVILRIVLNIRCAGLKYYLSHKRKSQSGLIIAWNDTFQPFGAEARLNNI
jgi:hypothetical protein